MTQSRFGRRPVDTVRAYRTAPARDSLRVLVLFGISGLVTGFLVAAIECL